MSLNTIKATLLSSDQATIFFRAVTGQLGEENLLRRLKLPLDNDPQLDATAFNFYREK
jgi:hypothetical protein